MQLKLLFSAFLVMIASLACADGVKYVFLLIGDGYGPNHGYITEALTGEKLAMSKMEKALFTGTDDVDGKITDSAASGTAIACGIKTCNGVLGVDKHKKPVESIAMKLKKKGFKIGLISSSPLTDATPAAFYAHQENRSMFKEIALDMAKSGFEFIGGAGVHGRGTLDNLKKAGWKVLEGSNVLSQVEPGVQTFVNSASSTPWNPGDTPAGPTLAEYLTKAVEVLNSTNGFFIMLENGVIDHLGHNNDAGGTWREVLELDAAVKAALEFQAKHPAETLVIVTADHETGGLQAENLDRKKLELLKRQKGRKSDQKWLSSALADKIVTAAPSASGGDKKAAMLKSLQDYLGIVFNDEERVKIEKSIDKALAARDAKGHLGKALNDAFKMRDERAGIQYTSGDHTSTRVLTCVQGPGSDKFTDPLENSDISHFIQAIVLPEIPDKEYNEERAVRVAKYLVLKPYRSFDKAPAGVLSVRPIPVETKVSLLSGVKHEIQLPDWSRFMESRTFAGDGSYYLELKNTSRDLPLFFGVELKTAPADARFRAYAPDSATIFLKEDGSEEWTAAEITRNFRAICGASSEKNLLFSTEARPEFARNKRNVKDIAADYARMPKQIPVLEIKSARNAPVVDGKLDDAVWKDVKSYALVSVDGAAIADASTAKVLTDKARKTLYLALSSPDRQIVCKSTKRDTTQWADDCFEIFIGDADTDLYYHIVINSAGSIYDAERRDITWNAEINVKTSVDTDQNIWTAELAIPLDQFNFKNAVIGNICRTGMPGYTYSNLAPTRGEYHNKANFIPFMFSE